MANEKPETSQAHQIDPTKIDVSIATDGSTVSESTVNVGDLTGHDKTVQGDEVHGDKVSGDKISVGDINGGTGIAIGHGATVHVHEAPKQRIPLQRPARVEYFVDRASELAQLLADLQPGRVITLCGPGGIGKTALAAEAIWSLAPNDTLPAIFSSGILFHSFYNQPQTALALEHIARSFGEDPTLTPKEAAQRALAGRRALLILDGAEQADDLRQIVDIRDQCTILITSRQRGDAVSQRQDIAPLPLDEAVILLQAWGGQRAHDSTAARHIAELVGRLPLALRLVGRYLAQNEEDIKSYLDWLTKTPLIALDQGQHNEESVPLLLKRSIEQVGIQSRQVLGVIGRLALAPFDRDIISTVLELSDVETRHTFGELISYGLLSRPAKNYVVTHALIHTYARNRLHTDMEEIFRLAIYYINYVNNNQGNFEQLDSAIPHVLAVLSSCIEFKAWHIICDLAQAIDDYLELRGSWNYRETSAKAGLVAANELQDHKAEGVWLSRLGSTNNSMGQYHVAINLYSQALAKFQTLGDRQGEGIQLGNLGSVYRNLGELTKGIDFHQEALDILREINDRPGQSNQLRDLGRIYLLLGQPNKAMNLFQEALAIQIELGDRHGKGELLGHLGSVYLRLGQAENAIDFFKQSLVIHRDTGDRNNEGRTLGNMGLAYRNLGEMEQAINSYLQALVIQQEIGDRRGVGNQLGNLGVAYYHLNQMEKSIDLYQQALVIHREIGDRLAEGIQMGNMGVVYYSLGEREHSITCFKTALTISQEVGDRVHEGIWLGNLGDIYKDLGQLEQAITQFQLALVVSRETGHRFYEGIWLHNLSTTYSQLGQYIAAQELGYEALIILEEIKSPYAETVRVWLKDLEGQHHSI